MFRPELYNRFHVSKFMVSAPAKIVINTPMDQIMQTFDDTKAWNLPVVDENGHQTLVHEAPVDDVAALLVEPHHLVGHGQEEGRVGARAHADPAGVHGWRRWRCSWGRRTRTRPRPSARSSANTWRSAATRPDCSRTARWCRRWADRTCPAPS